MNDKFLNLKKLFHEKISLGQEVDDQIIEQLDEILYSINSLEIQDLRQQSATLSYELHDLGSNSVAYLMLLLFNKLEAVSFKPTRKASQFNSIEINDSDVAFFMKYFESCFDSCDNGIRILDFKPPSLSENEKVKVYSSTRSLLDKFVAEPINPNELNADIPPRMVCLALSRVLSSHFNCQHEFYIQFCSILQRMNRDGLFQESRDCAEEALLCSHNSNEIYFGYYVKLSLYTSQMNVIDSLINCCLLLTSLCQEKIISHELIEKLYIEIFLALRTFNFYDYAKDIYYKHIVNLNLNEFDKQKCDLALLYLNLMESNPETIKKSDVYIKLNKNKILNFGKSSLTPWFAFICNLKTNFPDQFSDAIALKEFEEIIVNILPSAEINALRNKILKGRPEGKEVVRAGLENLVRTRNSPDFIHEVNQLVVTANRVIETSIKTRDIEGILLAHQLKSDGSVYFDKSHIQPDNNVIQYDFNVDLKNTSRFKKYLEFVERSLSVTSPKQFVWIGFNNDKLYCVIFEGGSFTFCDYVLSTNKKEIIDWIKVHLPELAFVDTPDTGSPFVTREDFWAKECNSIISTLPCIDIPISSSELVLFCDVEFSSFPHNMIKTNGSIVALNQAIHSPLSFDNYLQSKSVTVDIKNIFAWAPTVEKDMAISIAFSKLKDELGTNGINYDENLMPNPSCDINIFISHGGRDGNSGFCGLYPTSGKSYMTDKIFGHGKVAILFVCHSGSIVENHYSNSTHTLIKNLLKSGYETVISPSWSLNVSIPGIWAKEFINSLKSKKNITESVYQANLLIHNHYLSPSASTAMHIFGNGDVKCA